MNSVFVYAVQYTVYGAVYCSVKRCRRLPEKRNSKTKAACITRVVYCMTVVYCACRLLSYPPSPAGETHEQPTGMNRGLGSLPP